MTAVEAGGPRKVGWRGDREGGSLLLVHGAGEDSRVFGPLVGLLPEAFAVDLPGHGESAGRGLDDVGAYGRWVLDHLPPRDLADLWIGGHSMGGAVALSMVLDDDAGPKGLVLISSGGRLRVHPDLLAGLETNGRVPERFVQAMVAPGKGAQSAESALTAPGEVTLGDFRACDRFDVLERLGEIRVPVLVVVGDQDVFTPVRHARVLAGATGGTLRVVPGAGHLLPLEEPGALAACVATWLSDARPGGQTPS